jgi:hypothetical protein
MPLAEGVSQRIAYKVYSTGVITANTQPLITADPQPAGGQILRRVSSTLELAKNTYKSNEVRTDRQIFDFRHGTRHVQGKIAGELSPSTYFDFFEAVHRDTRAAGVAIAPGVSTSVAASNAESSFTMTAGDAVVAGLKVGDIIRPTGGAVTANNGVNFTIISFAEVGGAYRTINVVPAPADAAADAALTLTRPGFSTLVPLANQISRKFALEIYGSDVEVARVFKECRMSGYTMAMPATGMSTCDFDVMGRDMDVLIGGAAPFFTAPAAATTTGVCASVNGILVVDGASQGVITGVNLTMQLTPTAADVVGQNFPAEIFLGRADLTGTLTAYFQDATLVNDFLNETESTLILTVDDSSAFGADVISLTLPRIKLGGASINITGEGGQMLTAPFQALLYEGTAAGMPNTTIRINDTAVAA